MNPPLVRLTLLVRWFGRARTDASLASPGGSCGLHAPFEYLRGRKHDIYSILQLDYCLLKCHVLNSISTCNN